MLLVLLALWVGSSEAVIGGRQADRDDAPYYVYLRFLHNRCGMPYCFQHCGGTLIDSKHVLTSAHCLHLVPGADGMDLSAWTVSSATRGMDSRGFGGSSTRPTHIHVSPYYRQGSPASDLAIFTLKKELRGVRPAVIEGAVPQSAVWAQASGGGMYDPNPGQLQNSNSLRVVDVRLDSCGRTGINARTTQGAFCSTGEHRSGRGSASVCSGDSGGPLTVNHRLVGVSSMSTCRERTRNIAALFTPVMTPNNLDWIRRIATAAVVSPSAGAAAPSPQAPAPRQSPESQPFWRQEHRNGYLYYFWDPRRHQRNPPVPAGYRVVQVRPGTMVMVR